MGKGKRAGASKASAKDSSEKAPVSQSRAHDTTQKASVASASDKTAPVVNKPGKHVDPTADAKDNNKDVAKKASSAAAGEKSAAAAESSNIKGTSTTKQEIPTTPELWEPFSFLPDGSFSHNQVLSPADLDPVELDPFPHYEAYILRANCDDVRLAVKWTYTIDEIPIHHDNIKKYILTLGPSYCVFDKLRGLLPEELRLITLRTKFRKGHVVAIQRGRSVDFSTKMGTFVMEPIIFIIETYAPALDEELVRARTDELAQLWTTDLNVPPLEESQAGSPGSSGDRSTVVLSSSSKRPLAKGGEYEQLTDLLPRSSYPPAPTCEEEDPTDSEHDHPKPHVQRAKSAVVPPSKASSTLAPKPVVTSDTLLSALKLDDLLTHATATDEQSASKGHASSSTDKKYSRTDKDTCKGSDLPKTHPFPTPATSKSTPTNDKPALENPPSSSSSHSTQSSSGSYRFVASPSSSTDPGGRLLTTLFSGTGLFGGLPSTVNVGLYAANSRDNANATPTPSTSTPTPNPPSSSSIPSATINPDSSFLSPRRPPPIPHPTTSIYDPASPPLPPTNPSSKTPSVD